MFRQSLRRCARMSSAGFAAPCLRTRPVVLKAVAVQSRLAPCASASINAIRLYSSEATAVASEEAKKEGQAPLSRFEDLHRLGVNPNLLNTITKDLKYETMTDVQAKTIEPALKGMDLVAQAKTGTGKTLAFLIPILQRMIVNDPSLASRRARSSADATDIRGIIVSPTRELAEQIANEAQKLCANTGLIVQRAVGGTRRMEMLRQTRRQGCHLLVATPGRLNDLLSDPYSGIKAPNLAAIVLDEADRMLDVGFEKELKQIVSYLPDPHESQRQTMLFSATIPKSVISLARSWVRPDNFDFIQTVSPNDVLTHERVPQHVVNCKGWANVFPALYEIIHKELQLRKDNPDMMPLKVLVFMPTTGSVDLVSDIDRGMRSMRSSFEQFTSWKIHSKLTQGGRTDASESFRRAKSGILFSSDVTARGLDFPNVTHVIQIGSPSDREQYVHRLGRTGRAQKDGEGWLILPASDVRKAREELGGLPIKPAQLESALHDFTSSSEPDDITKAVTKATRNVDDEILERAYVSFFGQLDLKTAQLKVDELREWFIDAMGKEDTPYINPSKVQKIGMGRIHGINTTRPPPPPTSRSYSQFRDGDRGFGRTHGPGHDSRGFYSERRGFGRDNRGRGAGGGFDRRDREPRDGFEKMAQGSESNNRYQRREIASF